MEDKFTYKKKFETEKQRKNKKEAEAKPPKVVLDTDADQKAMIGDNSINMQQNWRKTNMA